MDERALKEKVGNMTNDNADTANNRGHAQWPQMNGVSVSRELPRAMLPFASFPSAAVLNSTAWPLSVPQNENPYSAAPNGSAWRTPIAAAQNRNLPFHGMIPQKSIHSQGMPPQHGRVNQNGAMPQNHAALPVPMSQAPFPNNGEKHGPNGGQEKRPTNGQVERSNIRQTRVVEEESVCPNCLESFDAKNAFDSHMSKCLRLYKMHVVPVPSHQRTLVCRLISLFRGNGTVSSRADDEGAVQASTG